MFNKLININTNIFKITNFYDEKAVTFNAKEKDIIDTTIRSSVSKDSKLLIAELFSKVMDNSNILKAISKEVSNVILTPITLIKVIDINKLILIRDADSGEHLNTCIKIEGTSIASTQLSNILKSNILPATEEEIDSFLSVIEVGEMLNNLMDALGIVFVEVEESETLLKPTLVSERINPHIYKVQAIKSISSDSYDIVRYLCNDNHIPIKGQVSKINSVSGYDEANKIISKYLKTKNNLSTIIAKQERKLNSMMRD